MEQTPIRYNWIDWMKTIGMYLIILGHFFSIGHKYIYVFSVPLFFILSGFLSKKEESRILFWEKIWHNLLLPMILMVLISAIIEGTMGLAGILFPPITLDDVLSGFWGLMIGSQKVLAGCWFIYTLVLLKCILQYTAGLRWASYIHMVLLVAFAFIAVLLENSFVKTEEGANSIINVFVAYPFFIFGYYAKSWKQLIASFTLTLNRGLLILLFLVLMVIVIGNVNGYVWMYRGGYGADYVMFIVGGIVGTLLVFVISKMLGECTSPIVRDVSNGSIIILGFHYYVVIFLCHYTDKDSVLTFFYSLLILIAFVPIIRLTNRFFPILLGRRSAK